MNEVINSVNEIQRQGRKDLFFGISLGLGSILLGVLSAKRIFEAGMAAGCVEVLNDNVEIMNELKTESKKRRKYFYQKLAEYNEKKYQRNESE